MLALAAPQQRASGAAPSAAKRLRTEALAASRTKKRLHQLGGVEDGAQFGDEALRRVYQVAGEGEAREALEAVRFVRVGEDHAALERHLERAQRELADTERTEKMLTQRIGRLKIEHTQQVHVRVELERAHKERTRTHGATVAAIVFEQSALRAEARDLRSARSLRQTAEVRCA